MLKILQVASKNIITNIGRGHTEYVYHNALNTALKKENIFTKSEVKINYYNNKTKTNIGFGRADIVVYNFDDCIPIEIKATNQITQKELFQIFKYSNALNNTGYLVNFGNLFIVECSLLKETDSNGCYKFYNF